MPLTEFLNWYLYHLEQWMPPGESESKAMSVAEEIAMVRATFGGNE